MSSGEMLAQLALPAWPPRQAVVLIGTNDMLNSQKLATFDRFRNNLEAIYGQLLTWGCAVAAVTLPGCDVAALLTRHAPGAYAPYPPEERLRRGNAVIRAAAARYGLPVAEFDCACTWRQLQGDGVHLNQSGCALLAQLVAARLRCRTDIVCYGDSLTFGHGVPPECNYPSVLRKLLEEAEDVVPA